MKRTIFFITLAGITVACFGNTHFDGEVNIMNSAYIDPNDANHFAVNSEIERFQIGLDRHYGFSLHDPDDFQKITIIDSSNKKAKEKIQLYWNLPERKFKRLFCDCTGIKYQKYGFDHFNFKAIRCFIVPNEVSIESVKNPEYID